MTATILAFPLARRRRHPMMAARDDIAADLQARRVARLMKLAAEAYRTIMMAGYHPQKFADRWGLHGFETLDRERRLTMKAARRFRHCWPNKPHRSERRAPR
jgi:hypothetical protein